MAKKTKQDAVAPEEITSEAPKQDAVAPEESEEDELKRLSRELSALKDQERVIKARMQEIAEERHKESAKTTALDHQRALRAASEALREAGMIPIPGAKRNL